MSDKDTICAVSTPPGEGGIGIIRISGRDAVRIAGTIFRPRRGGDLQSSASHTIHYGHVIDPCTAETIDEVLVSVMRAPATYTREDVVEINCHGGVVPLWRTIGLLIQAGARQAEAGEFTKRAFLNGRIDLAQAEAVIDIIRAKTELSQRSANEQLLGGLSRDISGLMERILRIITCIDAALDFPDEDIEMPSGESLEEGISSIIRGIDGLLSGYIYGSVLREGVAAAIVGRTNVGKSSLLNALLRQNRAIVTEIPGTTRDVIEEFINISGIPLKILDTAGIRHTHDMAEIEGVKRSLAVIESADIVLIVMDGSQALTPEDYKVIDKAKGKTAIGVINKSDLPKMTGSFEWPKIQMEVSCLTGAGLDLLKQKLVELMKKGAVPPGEHAWAVNRRHKTILEQSKANLERALSNVKNCLSPEFISEDLRGAMSSLGLITGTTYTEDILDRIFSTFCIGK
ncbi:tRNA uridine-5-carboxymethylaminomethyl(34) synthesis GTPase MnmE [bacterium]|nr:tRNA uridine-5-carboxymethylaminomethyl(34) synthesis GTPase MnmE [bacterium]